MRDIDPQVSFGRMGHCVSVTPILPRRAPVVLRGIGDVGILKPHSLGACGGRQVSSLSGIQISTASGPALKDKKLHLSCRLQFADNPMAKLKNQCRRWKIRYQGPL